MSTRWQPSHSEQGRLQTASVDIVPEHVRAAAEHGLVTPKSATPAGLTQPDASVDAVLLLGPLYHLVGRVERLRRSPGRGGD
jgi:hypothetical protein